MITNQLWVQICSDSLISLNDSHVAQKIRHAYRRHNVQKHQYHNHVVHDSESTTECINLGCWQVPLIVMQQFRTAVQRGLPVAQTKSIFQKSIIPQHILPRSGEFHQQLMTHHMSPCIAMDHTFKFARIGTYNELVCKPIDNLKDNPNNNRNAQINVTVPVNAVNSRKYKKKVEFSKRHAQLLTVMDSNGLAVMCYIVPNGTVHYQQAILKYIVQFQLAAGVPANQIVNVVSVDNASQIADQLVGEYARLRPNELLTVLQDIWHARERIVRELVQGHPLKKDAAQDIRAIFARLIKCEYPNVNVFVADMVRFRDLYSQPVSYAAVGDMALIVNVGKLLGAKVMNEQQLLETYNRSRLEVDDSLNVIAAVLRKPGATALNNLISESFIGYTYNRTKVTCQQTKGTTSNEAFHRILNGRLSRFGGIRTFTTGQQYLLLIQYQYNYQRIHNTDQYWCEVNPLPLHQSRVEYTAPLPLDANTVLTRLQIDYKNYQVEWSETETAALKTMLTELASGATYKHTKDVFQFIGTHPDLNMKSTERIKYMIRKLRQQLVDTQSISSIPG